MTDPPPPSGPPPGSSPVPGPPPAGFSAEIVAAADRRLALPDLPPGVAAKLEFDKAAPRRFRSDRVPEPVQDDLRRLWNGIVADVYDEVAGLRRTKTFGRAGIERSLRRVADRLLQAERVVIVAGVHFPLKGDKSWKHVASAGAGGGASAAVEEVAAIGTAGTATTVAVVSAIVGEIFETYAAASARTHQYRRVGRSPDPALIVTDLAEAAGYGDSAGRRATSRVAHDAAHWLGNQLVRRTASRFARSLVPVFGVGAGAGMSAYGVRRVTKLPLRPMSEEEVLRLADEVRADPDAYLAARDRFLTLTRPDEPPISP